MTLRAMLLLDERRGEARARDAVPFQISLPRGGEEPLTFGRGPGIDVHLEDAAVIPALVSRLHASIRAIRLSGSEIHVIESKNSEGIGVYVNGSKLSPGWHPLSHRDRVGFGPSTVTRGGTVLRNSLQYHYAVISGPDVPTVGDRRPREEADRLERPAARRRRTIPDVMPSVPPEEASAEVQTTRYIQPPDDPMPDDPDALDEAALSRAEIERLRAEVTCCVCLDLMAFPVSLVPCGHNMCMGCAERWLAREAACPTCRAKASAGWSPYAPNRTAQTILNRHFLPRLTDDEREEREVKKRQALRDRYARYSAIDGIVRESHVVKRCYRRADWRIT